MIKCQDQTPDGTYVRAPAQRAQLNGTANVTAIEAAAKAGVPRFVFISAHIPNIPGIGEALGGALSCAMAPQADDNRACINRDARPARGVLLALLFACRRAAQGLRQGQASCRGGAEAALPHLGRGHPPRRHLRQQVQA